MVLILAWLVQGRWAIDTADDKAVEILEQFIAEKVRLGRPIPPYYYKHYYKNACSECMPVIIIVVPI